MPHPQNHAVVVMSVRSIRGSQASSIFNFPLIYVWREKRTHSGSMRFLNGKSKIYFPCFTNNVNIIAAYKCMLSLHTALLIFSCVLMVLQLLTTGRFQGGGFKGTILINGSGECGLRALGTQQRVTKYGKNKQMLHSCS